MTTPTETDIRRLLDTVPEQRRLQARAALTGSLAELVEVLHVLAKTDGGTAPRWETTLSMHYIVGFAARHRQPEQVAELDRGLRDICDPDLVLGAAASRPPSDLAVVAAHLEGQVSDAFVRAIVVGRSPEDIAVMLGAIRDNPDLRGAVARCLCLTAAPPKIARVVLYLRGMGAADPLSAILSVISRQTAEHDLADFLLYLERTGDAESVRETIIGVVAPGAARADADEAVDTGRVVSRVVALMRRLVEREAKALAKQVEDAAVREFPRTGEQHRLFALAFLFHELGMQDEARLVVHQIPTNADSDIVQMILRFCEDEPANAGTLVQIILAVPQESEVPIALDFVRRFGADSVRETIFEAVAKWPHYYHPEFDAGLGRTSSRYAEKFRDAVVDHVAVREGGAEISDILLWLLKVSEQKRGEQLAGTIIETVTQRRDPALLVDMICRIRDAGAWWEGGKDKLRERVADQVRRHYGVKHMGDLIKAAEDRCLPAMLRITPDWVIYGQRTDGEIVQVFRALKDARCDSRELQDAAAWSAHKFTRPATGTTPVRALEQAGLIEEGSAWFKGSKRVYARRPDPDPPLPPRL
jgi:hypothetical protein